jgi:hypothetical protein
MATGALRARSGSPAARGQTIRHTGRPRVQSNGSTLARPVGTRGSRFWFTGAENSAPSSHPFPGAHEGQPHFVRTLRSRWRRPRPSPRSTRPMIEDLIQLLGPANVLVEREDLIPYSFDATAALRQMPSGRRVSAQHAAEVSAILGLAQRHKVPVVPRGSGTGLSGGSVPVPKARRPLPRQDGQAARGRRAQLHARAEAGVLTQAIYDAADAAGLFYPPDPGR